MREEVENANKLKQQRVYFSSLKALWLSKIPLTERQSKFPDALEQIPSRLVTTSVFCNIFYPQTRGFNNLDAERAWFGIRSILKGGVLAVEHNGNYSVDDFAQLAAIKNRTQIPKRHTSEYFSNEELRLLLKVYHEYQKWISKKGFYDDIDLVLRALKHEEGSAAKRAIERDKRFTESLTKKKAKRRNAINKIRLNDPSVVFKKPAQKHLEKLSNQQDNLEIVHGWVCRNILDKKPFNRTKVNEIRNRHVDDTESGVPIHKSPLDNGGRIYWTPISNKDKTCTIVIYDFCVTKEDGDPRLKKILKNYKHEQNPSSEDDEEDFDDKATPTDFSIDDTPCEGPVKPWPHSVNTGFGLTLDIIKDSNILLDDLQRETILSNQPLLIDGLAGTGKTSVLAYRGVVRAAVSSEGTTILVTASKDHVVQRISETMSEIKENGDWNDNEFEMNYVLAPGISNEKIPASSIDAFSATIPEEGFDEIILDESQDITVVEFEMLRRLLIGHNLRRLVFAGDPLQTLNPTGFDWNRIQAMFIEGEVSQDNIEITKFHNNYRSQRKIVEFANAVQTKRSRLFKDKNQTIMEAKKGGTDLVRIIRYDLSMDNHMTAISDIIADAGESKAVIVTPLSDDLGIKNLLSGEENQEGEPDRIMSNVWRRIEADSESEASIENFRKSLYLHSASSIKGAEYDIVVLYNFASSGQARESLKSLLQNLEDIEPLGKEDGIRIRYEFSKLYVALTRAFDRIYLIEDQNGFDFWKDVKLYMDDELVGIEAFIDFNLYSDPLQAVNCDDLKPEIEANRENYSTQRNKFLKDPTNIIALEFAINLGKRLVKNINDSRDEIHNEILELEAEFAWYQSRQAGRDEKEKSSLAEEALQKFTKAGMYNKATPIYFSQKRYKQCLDNLPNNDKELIKLIRYVCQIKMPSSGRTQVRPDDEIVEECISLLKEKKINVDDNWAKINPVDECKGIIRKWALENCALSQILEFDNNDPVVFKVQELTEQFEEDKDVIKILEDRKLTKTSNWKAIYNENVTHYISSITNVNRQNEEFYSKIDKINIKNKNIKKLRRTIDEKMLEAIPTVKNPSRDLAKVIQELEGYSASSKIIETNPNDISGDQWRALYLLNRIHKEYPSTKYGIWNRILSKIGNKSKEPTTALFVDIEEIQKELVT
ncbi:MAG: AAA family ATPase, partial [Candidatus Poseidoniaceae archaeon]